MLFFYKPILLEIVLTDGWTIFLAIIIIFIIYRLIVAKNELDKQKLEFQKKDAELKVTYQNWALSELEKFKNTEITKVASVLLQQWKIENEAFIRQDAINRSYSVNLGKITEHLIPFHINFPFNPKDVRFIGSPIDLIVFDGSADKNDNIIIYIVEIKTGNSKLTDIQKKIKTAVIKGDIRWFELNPDDEKASVINANNLNQLGDKFSLK
jgi:predicted Holliday junction resolvase-like endonuclease